MIESNYHPLLVQGSFSRSGFSFKVYYPSNRTVEDRYPTLMILYFNNLIYYIWSSFFGTVVLMVLFIFVFLVQQIARTLNLNACGD